MDSSETQKKRNHLSQEVTQNQFCGSLEPCSLTHRPPVESLQAEVPGRMPSTGREGNKKVSFSSSQHPLLPHLALLRARHRPVRQKQLPLSLFLNTSPPASVNKGIHSVHLLQVPAARHVARQLPELCLAQTLLSWVRVWTVPFSQKQRKEKLITY